MHLHHPILVPDLVEAWILDRLPVAATGDGDRPSLRFFRDRAEAAAIAQAMQDRWDDGAALPFGGGEVRQGAVLTFARATLGSATRLVSVRQVWDDLAEDEVELRARTDLLRCREHIATIHLGDEEIDFWAAYYRAGHPDDDGTGRWTRAVLDTLDALYSDPRRIPGDLLPPIHAP
ncbi:hypothetical protein [Methylobacterium gossipiicola]|uniref:Uncharacterized protein n=1 Tax=Methylobacterium gossipiicola TaxID=582675 RepID=A0A1I2WF73_9HYPH|nr:hypothetical protein [Methylobacterium gossipiicola]SFG99953.1 hypothetical protein SAMN05192565_12274 [Methylobacterium gossipiicola]